VAGPVATIENALHLRMREFRSPAGRVFHAPDTEPEFPAALAVRIEGVVGLDDAAPPRPIFAQAGKISGAPRGAAPAAIGTGQNSKLSPSDIRTMYDFNGVTQDGSGNTIALLELDGYTASDITAYEDQYGLPHVGMLNVLLDGVSGTPTAPTPQNQFPGSFEVTLDIDLALALAPGIHQIDVYEGTSMVDVFNQIASDNSAQIVSCSWGAGETAASASIRNSENTAFQQMASQGQSLFCASGDNGDQACNSRDSQGNCVYTFGVTDPASQPWCTAVGGTTVTTVSAGGAWQSETAWSGSGGGVSTIWTLPYYQSAGVTPGSGGSDTFRNVPDVSLDSNSGYSVYYVGAWDWATGTSCAAPLWGAFTARLNQRRVGLGLANIGFINPALYLLGYSGSRATGFHDITTGNNGTYPAVTGYDNVTGWGSFDGANLLPDLCIDAGVFWVDSNYNGIIQNGTPLFPYHSLSTALGFVPANTHWLLYVRGGSYPENVTMTENVVIVNNGGGVVGIGQ
jgi:kumamolisin